MPDWPTSDPRLLVQGAPVLHVPDVEASAAWYRDVLGFTWDFGDAQYAVVWRDNAAIHFSKGEQPPAGVHVFLWVRDVDAYHQELASRGAESVQPPTDRPYGIRECAFRDPNDVLLVIGQDID